MKNSKIAVIVTVCVVAVLFASFIAYNEGESDSDGFIIVHTNDTHCYFGDDGSLGFSTVKALKDSYEERGETVFVVDAGDFMQGNSYGTLTNGEAAIEVMNAVGYDVGIPGNHEFDFTLEVMLENISGLNFPIICSNLIYKSSGESIFPEYIVLEKGGKKVGFFGLLTPDTEKEAKKGCMGDSKVTDPFEAAERMVGILEEMDLDCIVALGHVGLDRSSTVNSDQICSMVSGIDIFIDGHSHTEMEYGKVCNGTIDVIPSDTTIASTGCFSAHVGTVTVTGDGEIEAKLYRGEKIDDAPVDDVVKKIHDDVEEILSQKIGHTEIFLDGERENVRTKETNLANLVADSMRASTGSDIAVINGGAVRTSIPPGDITMKDAYDVNPFINILWVMDVTGKDLKNLMEFSYNKLGEVFGGFIQISGMTVKYDASKDPGARVVSIEVNGQIVDDDDKFTLVTTDFIATGGDGNETFIGLRHDIYGEMLPLMVDYIRSLGDITESSVTMERQIAV